MKSYLNPFQKFQCIITKYSNVFCVTVAQSEDSPVAMKLKKICLKTPIGEEQAAQAVLDPAIGKHKV